MIVVNGGQSEVKLKTSGTIVERVTYADATLDANVLPPLSVTLYKPSPAE